MQFRDGVPSDSVALPAPIAAIHMNTGLHIIVKGYVQGVGFRYHVYRHASKLGVRGFARNMPNGDVEVYAEGEHALLEELLKQVRIGPRSAEVTDTAVTWSAETGSYSGFEIL